LRRAAFTGRADGAFPLAGVILDNNGKLYGTTSAGGKGTPSARRTAASMGAVREPG
jgi:hypothetical protein